MKAAYNAIRNMAMRLAILACWVIVSFGQFLPAARDKQGKSFKYPQKNCLSPSIPGLI
jgi:hypothetical protein